MYSGLRISIKEYYHGCDGRFQRLDFMRLSSIVPEGQNMNSRGGTAV